MALLAGSRRQRVVRVMNGGYEVSFEVRGAYVSIEAEDAKSHSMVRVNDKSSEDYLYPRRMLLPINLPWPVRRAVLTAA
jgi:hypothetical protein